MPNILEMKD